MIAVTPKQRPRPVAATEAAYQEEDFPALRLARSSRFARRIANWLLVTLAVTAAAMFLAPWQQTIRGTGSFIALDPFERMQMIPAPIKGRIASRGEGVAENAFVKKNQLLFEIVDLDPQKLEVLQSQVNFTTEELAQAQSTIESLRLQRGAMEGVVAALERELTAEKNALQLNLAAADAFIEQQRSKKKAAEENVREADSVLWEASFDRDRQLRLSSEGAAADKTQQKAEQKYRAATAKLAAANQYVAEAQAGIEGKQSERAAKLESGQAKIASVRAKIDKAESDLNKQDSEIQKAEQSANKVRKALADIQSKLRTQESQRVFAPRAGRIMRLAVVDDASIVKEGQELCTIVPDITTPAVEIKVSGNDMPLISPGREVRLQFEGWPAIQFSGWPTVAFGTFGGRVQLVDPGADATGKFRVVVVPDKTEEAWPDAQFLRQGARANGWVLLDTVPLGYEIWRLMNGFPPALSTGEEAPKLAKPPKIKT